MRNHPRPTCISINSTAPPQKKKTSVNSTGWRPLHTICITVLAHPASPAADDPDLQLHPGGAVPRRAADEVALPGSVEPDRVAAGHQRDRDGALRRAGKVPVPGRPITVNVGKYLLLRPITNQKCASDAKELGIAQRYVTVH